MFEGDLEEGELEIGQVSAGIHNILPAAAILENIWQEYLLTKSRLQANLVHAGVSTPLLSPHFQTENCLFCHPLWNLPDLCIHEISDQTVPI